MVLEMEVDFMDKLIGDRIKSLRNAHGLTQEQVADRIGMSRQRYARIENGYISVTLEILTELAGLFNVTVGDITRVLDETPVVAYRSVNGEGSSQNVFDMLDLFYANKRLYDKLQNNE